jgi:phenylacetaldehyde dehydrogenase
MDIATAHARLNSAASSFLAGKHQLLIDGKWVDAKSGKRFDVFDPATGQAIARRRGRGRRCRRGGQGSATRL